MARREYIMIFLLNKLACIIVVLLVIVFANACIKPFNPPPSARNLNYLVVDGILTAGSATTIKLSRTQNISDTFRFVPERNARLFIQAQSGSEYDFQDMGDGVYKADSGIISTADKYRLKIITRDGNEYNSDYVEVKQSPEIDSLEWDQDDDVLIYLNTHDPSGNTRYYRWEFDETSEYTSTHNAELGFRNGEIVELLPEEKIYTCYQFFNSTNIIIGSSSSLTEDVIRRAFITSVPNNYEKIRIRYSILVKQYALTPEAYKYWQTIKLNTEPNGSIFDPQPSKIPGNIHNVRDPDEPVIGFLTASSISEKRLFIRMYDLPDLPYFAYDSTCAITVIPPYLAADYLSDPTLVLPVYFELFGLLAIAPARCVDCRLQGGVTQKPSYW